MTELKPAKFGVEKVDPRKISPVTEPNQFGQVYDNQKDNSSGEVPSAQQSVHQHRQSDVDSNPWAHHHTLGTRRNQASPGNHIHDGVTSPKIGALKMNSNGNGTVPEFILSGSKDGNVALTNLISFLKLHFNFTDNTT